MRSSRSASVQSATGIGGSTATWTVPGFIVAALREPRMSVLRKTMGVTGTPAVMAMRKAPFLKGLGSPVTDRVPSGAMTTDMPPRSRSVTGRMASIAPALSDRSIMAASRAHAMRAPSGDFVISFLPTPLLRSRTSLATTNESKLVKWLWMNTLGRAAHRLAAPTTSTLTPLRPSIMSTHIGKATSTPARRSRLTNPTATPTAAAGITLDVPAILRTMCGTDRSPPRLDKCSTGQPRRAATLAR